MTGTDFGSKTFAAWRSAADQTLTDYVVEGAEAGDIILFHGMFSGNAATREAMPGIVEGLTARGFDFVTVSEILAE